MNGYNESIPILSLSSHQSPRYATALLRAGADDYMRKPVDLKEFYIRLKKRTWRGNQQMIRLSEEWTFDQEYGDLLFQGNGIGLTTVQKRIFACLLRKRNRSYATLDELMDAVYGHDVKSRGTIISHIRNLRKLLPEGWIVTKRQVGYMLVVKEGG